MNHTYSQSDVISNLNMCQVVLDCITEKWWSWFTKAMHQEKYVSKKKVSKDCNRSRDKEPQHTPARLRIQQACFRFREAEMNWPFIKFGD